MSSGNHEPISDKDISADKNGTNRQEWNWHPDLPITNNPLFEMPWKMAAIWAYHRDTWLRLSEVSFFLLLAIMSFYMLQPVMPAKGDTSNIGWLVALYAINLGLVGLVAGG
ncbi:MAG: hypothetical protein HON06_04100, partial [Candidatus Puniceispirillum sp.]|nr:hypothetical protein [Candidatus Puniceispirillum sp.]